MSTVITIVLDGKENSTNTIDSKLTSKVDLKSLYTVYKKIQWFNELLDNVSAFFCFTAHLGLGLQF